VSYGYGYAAWMPARPFYEGERDRVRKQIGSRRWKRKGGDAGD